MKTPKKVRRMYFTQSCSDVTLTQHIKLMENTTKANGSLIRKHIKEHEPELYESLALDFPNPYEHQCRKKDNLFVYMHSAIEYFFRYEA